MWSRLFGENESAQLQFLQPRVILTVLSGIAAVIGMVIQVDLTMLFALVMLFVWGWSAVKSLFGVTTIGAIFSGNAVIGAILITFYVLFAYVFGLVVAALGVGRYIYLKLKLAKAK